MHTGAGSPSAWRKGGVTTTSLAMGLAGEHQDVLHSARRTSLAWRAFQTALQLEGRRGPGHHLPLLLSGLGVPAARPSQGGPGRGSDVR